MNVSMIHPCVYHPTGLVGSWIDKMNRSPLGELAPVGALLCPLPAHTLSNHGYNSSPLRNCGDGGGFLMGNGPLVSSTSHRMEPLPMVPNVSLLQTVHHNPHLAPFSPWATGVPCKVARWLASVEKLSLG